MPKVCKEKVISLNKCLKFPMDIWSYVVNLQTFTTMGPQLVLSNGEAVASMESCSLYTVRTRRELIKTGIAKIQVGDNMYVISISEKKCADAFIKFCEELIDSVHSNIDGLKLKIDAMKGGL